MELSSLLQDLHLSSSSSSSSSSEKPLPPPPLPPITELLSQLREKLIGASDRPSETNALIGRVERLFQVADPDWLFSAAPANQEGGWEELGAAYVSLISALIGCAALPLCEDDCSPPSASAYQRVPAQAATVCSALTALQGTLGKSQGGGGASVLLAVAPPTCVFAVTHFQEQAWTSSASRAAARCLMEAVLRAGHWRDSAHLLMGEEGRSKGILGGVLDVLQPHLNRDWWRHGDWVKCVFSWTLLQVTRPHLSPHLPRLLPPSLLLLDHHRPENCILGVRCLHHIILHTAAADLRQFNRADVLYQALFTHLYSPEAALTQLVLSCLSDLLLVLEKLPPSSSSSSCSSSSSSSSCSSSSSSSSSSSPSSPRRRPCRRDDVLRLVLTHMEAEHKVALRRVYSSALLLFIDGMGVAMCRHLCRLERVVLSYLEVKDPPEETSRLNILEVLEKMIRGAWPRMETRVHALLCCLLRLLVDVSSDLELSDSVRQQLIGRICVCIKLLDACSHGNVQLLLQQLDSSCCSSEVLGYLATVTMATDR